MKTAEEKYMNDPEFNMLVNQLEASIERAQFTPSELREAAVYAAIRYEMRRPLRSYIHPSRRWKDGSKAE